MDAYGLFHYSRYLQYREMITNKDLIAYGRQEEQRRMQDRSIYLLHRIRVIESDMKEKLVVLQQLRVEYDQLQEQRAKINQTQLPL